jgi:putative glutamine amidotransferase
MPLRGAPGVGSRAHPWTDVAFANNVCKALHVMARPLILVTCWRRYLPTFLGERTLLDTLDPAYADRVAEAGGWPLLVTRQPAEVRPSPGELIELADGLVLTGGGDVDPASYGAPPEDVADEDPEADAFELGLLRAAERARLPTLAICRGAQLLAVAHGGRLAQQPPPTDGHPAFKTLSGEQIPAARHEAALAQGSRLRSAFGRELIAVNTIHHHQIADAGDLRVTGLAPGGVIEGVEPAEEWPCVGVQWHPEKMHEPEQRALFTQLVRDAGSGVDVAALAATGSRP